MKIVATLIVTALLCGYGETLKCLSCKGDLKSACAHPADHKVPYEVCRDAHELPCKDCTCLTESSVEMDGIGRGCVYKSLNGKTACELAAEHAREEGRGQLPKDFKCTTCDKDLCY